MEASKVSSPDLNSGVQTRSRLKNFCAFNAFLSLMEPKNINEALTDSDWIVAMQDELHQFERNQVWHLVPKAKRQNHHWNQVGVPK